LLVVGEGSLSLTMTVSVHGRAKPTCHSYRCTLKPAEYVELEEKPH
jgi:hypothetical protein